MTFELHDESWLQVSQVEKWLSIRGSFMPQWTFLFVILGICQGCCKTSYNAQTAPTAKNSVQFSCWVVSDSLWPRGPQHARPPCPNPRVYPNSKELSGPKCHYTWTEHYHKLKVKTTSPKSGKSTGFEYLYSSSMFCLWLQNAYRTQKFCHKVQHVNFFSEFKWEDSNGPTTILTDLRKSEKGNYFAIAISQTLD